MFILSNKYRECGWFVVVWPRCIHNLYVHAVCVRLTVNLLIYACERIEKFSFGLSKKEVTSFGYKSACIIITMMTEILTTSLFMLSLASLAFIAVAFWRFPCWFCSFLFGNGPFAALNEYTFSTLQKQVKRYNERTQNKYSFCKIVRCR